MNGLWFFWLLFFSNIGEASRLSDTNNLYQGYIYVKLSLSPNIDSLQPQEIIPTMKLTLYGDYLIEAITQTNSNTHVSIGVDSTITNDAHVSYDTIGYCFIDLKKSTYLMFDTAKKESKITERGDLNNKSTGLSFNYQPIDAFKNDATLAIKDTVDQGHPCKLATTIFSDTTGPMLLKAWIRPDPQEFPFQISPYLSQKTGGGFTNQVEFIDLGKEKAVLRYQVFYREASLSENTVQLINAWAVRSGKL